MGSLTKALIGKEDCDVADSGTYETFNRLTSTGSTITLTSFPDIWKSATDMVNAKYYSPHTATGASLNAAVGQTVNNSCKDIYIEGGEWVISTDYDWSSYTTVRWIFGAGAYLSIAAGCTVTFPSSANIVASPNQRILSGVGTVKFDNPGPAYIEWWGAKGDYSTDNSTTIQKAFDDCYSSYTAYDKRMTLLFTSKKGYITTTALICKRGVDIIMDGRLYYQGSSNLVVLTIGEASQLNIEGRFKLQVQRITQSDWTSENSVGVKIINLGRSVCELEHIYGHTIGVQLLGDAAGVAYNTFTLGRIHANKIGLELTNNNSGWCNENLFLNGMFNDSGANVALDRWGVKITSEDAAYNNNCNVFLKPCFELGGGGAGVADPILIEYGDQNRFIGIRSEGNSTTTATISGTSFGNQIDQLYGYADSYSVSDSSTSLPMYNVFTDSYFYKRALGRLVFDSGAIHKRAIVADGTNGFSVPRLTIHGSGTSHAPVLSATITSLTSNYFEIGSTRMLGVYIDTTRAKEFIVYIDSDSSYGGRVAISCWDSSGTQLTSGGANHPYVVMSPACTYTTAYGGAYQDGSDLTVACKFKVHSDVTKIYLMIGGGTATLRTRGFQVWSTDNSGTLNAASWNALVEAVPGCYMASAVPTYRADIFKRGQVLWDNTPTSGAAMGWTCVSQVSTTLSGDEALGQTVISVTDATGISNGDRVTVVLDSGVYHETTVNGAPVGNDVTITDALPSAAASGKGFYTMLWKAMPNLA